MKILNNPECNQCKPHYNYIDLKTGKGKCEAIQTPCGGTKYKYVDGGEIQQGKANDYCTIENGGPFCQIGNAPSGDDRPPGIPSGKNNLYRCTNSCSPLKNPWKYGWGTNKSIQFQSNSCESNKS